MTRECYICGGEKKCAAREKTLKSHILNNSQFKLFTLEVNLNYASGKNEIRMKLVTSLSLFAIS